MSVANLTRFGYIRVTTGISDDWDIAARSDGEYVKFEEAIEASSNSLQQLKAKISLGVGSIARDSSVPAVDRLDRIVTFVNEKLSAV